MTIIDLAPFFNAKRYLAERHRAPKPEPVYQILLLGPDVTIGELLHALRGSGLVVSTEPVTGTQVIHREPKGAA